MPKVTFLDIRPTTPTETITIPSEDGDVQIDVQAISLDKLGEISHRFPVFHRVIEGGVGSLMDAAEAFPAIIATGLGHHADEDYEKHAAKFPGVVLIEIVTSIVRLTFPKRDADPLSPGANAADRAGDEARTASAEAETSGGSPAGSSS